MKKPNKLYRMLGGRKSAAGSAFAVARHPVRSLKSVFGYDTVARDVAEDLNMAPTREAIQKVVATVRSWGRSCRVPRFNWLANPRPVKTPNTHRLEL